MPPPEDRRVRKLRKQLEAALAKQRVDKAIDLLEDLMELDPGVPRWPHKRGDLLRKRDRKPEAVEAYSVAVNLYAEQGFIARAVAMAKTILNLDPDRIDILGRVDPEAARRLHRQSRPLSMPLRPAHPAILPDDAPAPVVQHPAVTPGAAPQAAPQHPAVLPDSRAPAPLPAIMPEPPAAAAAPPLPAPPPAPGAAPKGRRRLALDQISIPITAPRGASPQPRPAPSSGATPSLTPSVIELADELTIAPDVRPNETRFSDAPPARAIELEVSDVELERRLVSPADDSLRPDPPGVSRLSKLPLFPLFAEIPKASMAKLVTGSEVIELSDGELVVRKGEPADALYGIVDGSVAVRASQLQPEMTLAEGDVFGEACLLPGEKRPADVQVRGHLTALRIPRDTLNDLLLEHPALAEVLLELLTRRLLGTLLVTSPLFQELDAHGRREMAHIFEVRRAPSDTLLAEEGKVMDGLYISLTGQLEVSASDGRPVELHGAGSIFGQSCLLARAPSEVTIRTKVPMIVLRLPAQAFNTMAMQHPSMLAHLSELSATPIANVAT